MPESVVEVLLRFSEETFSSAFSFLKIMCGVRILIFAAKYLIWGRVEHIQFSSIGLRPISGNRNYAPF